MTDETKFISEFVRESNTIEGINRDPLDHEIRETERFLSLPAVGVGDLRQLAIAYGGGRARLREQPGMDVCVGNHLPPSGGPKIKEMLVELLDELDGSDPWVWHNKYETLHPFMDGNGRTGRALWLWQMQNAGDPLTPLRFLHAFYYQTLAGART